MSFVIPFQYNETKKQELQQLIDDGQITFNYDVDCNVFTKHVDEHDEVIDGWDSSYGHITGLKSRIKQMYTSSKQRYLKKSIGICDEGSRKFRVILLCFNKPDEDGDREYGELIAKLFLKTNDEDVRKKIMANTEEIAGLIIARGNNSYALE